MMAGTDLASVARICVTRLWPLYSATTMATASTTTKVEAEEVILGSSLEFLYAYTPVTFWGDVFVHKRSGCTFESPNPATSSWGLHASSIWIASLFLADHIAEVIKDGNDGGSGESVGEHTTAAGKETLELGAGSGMSGIVLAKEYGKRNYNRVVTMSDYPDPSIVACLHQNIARNNIPATCIRVVGHAWGDEHSIPYLGSNAFDTIIAADTLWNSELHIPFCQTLNMTLKKSISARIYLVAGLHTGRWTIHHFVQTLTQQFPFILESITERFAGTTFSENDNYISQSDGDDDDDVERQDTRVPDRNWVVDRQGETEAERRRWVIWMVIKRDPTRLL